MYLYDIIDFPLYKLAIQGRSRQVDTSRSLRCTVFLWPHKKTKLGRCSPHLSLSQPHRYPNLYARTHIYVQGDGPRCYYCSAIVEISMGSEPRKQWARFPALKVLLKTLKEDLEGAIGGITSFTSLLYFHTLLDQVNSAEHPLSRPLEDAYPNQCAKVDKQRIVEQLVYLILRLMEMHWAPKKGHLNDTGLIPWAREPCQRKVNDETHGVPESRILGTRGLRACYMTP